MKTRYGGFFFVRRKALQGRRRIACMQMSKIQCIKIVRNALTAYALMHSLCLKPDRNRLLHRQRWTGLNCPEGWQLARVCSVKHHEQLSGGQGAAVGDTNLKRNRMASPVVACG